MSKHLSLSIGIALLGCLVQGAAARAAEPALEGVEFFEKKVRPVLAEHCFKCHAADAKKIKGGLLLDSRAGLFKGGDSGAAVVPGQPEKSRLIEAIGYKNVDLQMPPKGKLPETVLADLAAWIKMGAPWPQPDGSQGDSTSKNTFDLNQRKREHWAWQPIRSPELPNVRDLGWPRGPVDRLLLAKLEEKGLRPAAPAERRTLLRRAYFDLIGLPPTPAEVEAFLADRSPDAFEKVVDSLLASPHFGERWGRHWLDLVRYAETRGHEFDYPLPNAYQYRDYVIRAFNADLPYNQFVTEHVAGDLLEKPRLHPTEGFNESVLGTGFWFLGEEVHSPVDVRQDQADRFDNKIDVFGKAFLGLTVACARCHDHKFDAISAKDYYALYGLLESSSYRLTRFESMEHNRGIAADLWKLRDRARPLVQRALAEGARPALDHFADYLLAAREVMRIKPASPGGPDRQRLEEIAQARKLDAELLRQWVAYVPAAAKDANDLFHAWAKVAADAGTDDPKRLSELLRPLVESWRKRDADADAALNGVEVVVDYGKVRPEDWMQDGVTFGPGPVRPGDLRLGVDTARPILKVFDRAAAEKDPTWDVLKLAPGVENEAGSLGGWVRAGRTLCTPTFTVTDGKVFYLVKGNGVAYAAVDGHVMIAGPLHGHLTLPFQGGAGFRWVSHDLSAYKGQRAHVEFTPMDNADFAVALVVQAANAPGSVERPNHLLMQALTRDDAGSVEKIAEAYQRLFTDLAERLAADHLSRSAEAADYARLMGWLLQHTELLGEGVSKRVAEAARPFLAEQGKLVARIKPDSRLALAIMEGTGVDEHVFNRGSPKVPGERVPRRFLEALAGPDRLLTARGSGRLELARQMTDPALDPFLPRVMVNRVWHHLFGRGLVGSVDNFGVLGEAPTHPELLDYLADRFVKDRWSVKRLIRTLMLSRAYHMSSHPGERADQADPQNLLLHRMRVRRLEGEAIRDAMLAVSGRLDRRAYGPPVPVYLTAFQDGRGRPKSGPLDGDGRRSVYLAVRRNFLSSFLLAFDTPIPFSTMGRRTVSNVPAQALILMNDPFVHQQAEVWAKRVAEQGGSASERINGMYQSAFGRPPSEAELRACLEFLDRQGELAGGKPGEPAAWKDLAHMLFNAKEFIFVN
jgi:cytochrome c553